MMDSTKQLGKPFSIRAWQNKIAKRINQTEFALVDCPSVTRYKYQSKIRIAGDYVGVTRWRFVSQSLSHLMNDLKAEASSSELYSFGQQGTQDRNELNQ
jgi:hypothetical protein